MKIIVTGIAGFIGSHVAQRLIAQGHQVLGLDDLSGGFLENVPPGCDFERMCILQPLDRVFSQFKPTIVFHLAAYAAEGLSHHIPVFNYQNNLIATTNILEASYRAKVRHFVFTSSIAAYGHPLADEAFDEATTCRPCDPYGIAKFACEQQIAAFNAYYGEPSYTIFRPHNVFGPRQNISDPYRNVVGIFMRSALLNQRMPIFGDGSQSRSFSYIDPVADCVAQSPFIEAARNQVFNVGGDERMSVIQLARNICSVMQTEERFEFLPPRKEVQHAHCLHHRVKAAFPSAFRNPVGIAEGLSGMAAFVKNQSVPPATECPCDIEIEDALPESWAARVLSEVSVR